MSFLSNQIRRALFSIRKTITPSRVQQIFERASSVQMQGEMPSHRIGKAVHC